MTKAVESLFVIHLISQNCISINGFSEQLQLCFPLQHKKTKHTVSKSWGTFLFAVRSPETQPNPLKWILRQPRCDDSLPFLTDTDGSPKARMNLSVWFVGERIYSVRPPRNILWETMSQAAHTSLWTLKNKRNKKGMKSDLFIPAAVVYIKLAPLKVMLN